MNTGDILSTLDLLALDSACLTEFGEESLSILDAKRAVAVEHWLESRVAQAGHPVHRHQTRKVPDAVHIGATGAFTGVTVESASKAIDVNLASIVAGTHLYLGFRAPFSGGWFGLLDSVNTSSLSVSTYSYWTGGQWGTFGSLSDATYVSNSIALSGGGRVQWRIPDDWAPRPISGDPWLYWARMALTTSPTAPVGMLAQVLPIRRSRFTVPAAMHALGLTYRDAAVRTRGDWMDKATMFLDKADSELQVVMALAVDEFDADDSGAVGQSEASSLSGAGSWEWLRG